MQKLPGGKGSARHVWRNIPDNVGYTPGDTWEVYVDLTTESRKWFSTMAELQSRPRRRDVGRLQKAGPLLISTEHHGTADKKPVRVFFSDVAVKIAGSDNWVNAQ